MADKKKSKTPEKSKKPITKWEVPAYKDLGSNEIDTIYRYGYSNYDRDLQKMLQHRMKRNDEMGLETSPDYTTIQYGEGDPEFAGGNTQGYVRSDRPTNINISPLLRKTPMNPNVNEDDIKYTIAHELQHVNQLSNNREDYHENPKYISRYEYMHGLPFLRNPYTSEQLRRIRSLMHPYFTRKEIETPYDENPSKEPVFDVQKVMKYAKEQGVPVDDIIDAMTINAAIGSDEFAKEAHDQTMENQEVGRGILGDLGLEKPMSTEEVYKPWKEMRNKRLKKKFYSGGGV